ncbi:MAG: hypothetical protein KUG79_01600 [Pseudomonadales bacterium]|nr:hypothetical protein [Pseudomonadales bacterium]
MNSTVAKAGIAMTILYRRFETKGILNTAVLLKLDKQFRVDRRQFTAQTTTDLMGQLLASFDYLDSLL